jgi:hypothetical protein
MGRKKLPVGEKKITVSFTISPAIAQRIKIEAEECGLSYSQLVEDFIVLGLERKCGK